MDRRPCHSIPHIGLFISKHAYLVDQKSSNSAQSPYLKPRGQIFNIRPRAPVYLVDRGPIFTLYPPLRYMGTISKLTSSNYTKNQKNPRANPRAHPRAANPQPTPQPKGTQRIAPTPPHSPDRLISH